ncbi:hypothetical protein MASR2M79_10970 [Aminivibrio sp.]
MRQTAGEGCESADPLVGLELAWSRTITIFEESRLFPFVLFKGPNGDGAGGVVNHGQIDVGNDVVTGFHVPLDMG